MLTAFPRHTRFGHEATIRNKDSSIYVFTKRSLVVGGWAKARLALTQNGHGKREASTPEQAVPV